MSVLLYIMKIPGKSPMQSWKIMLYERYIREPLAFYLEEIYGKTESLRNR